MIVLLTHALQNEEPTRKIKLSENAWFIAEVLSVDKNVTFLLPKFKFNCHSVIFFKWWHAWRSSGFSSWPIRDNALQTLLSITSSLIDAGTVFISRLWYWALVTAFLSNWTILSLNKHLQFLLTVSSEEIISYRLKNHRNDWWDQIT